MLLILILILLLIYIFDWSVFDTIEYNIAFLLTISLISFLVLIFDREKKQTHKKIYLKHSILFSFGFLIVFFQIPLEYILGNIKTGYLIEYFIPSYNKLYESVLIASISFVSYVLGYFFAKRNNRLKKNAKNKMAKTYLLSFGSIISFLIYISVMGKDYFLGGYAETKFTPLMTYSNVLYCSITYAYLIQSAINLRVKYGITTLKQFFRGLNKNVLFIVFLYCILILLSGDRGPLITMVMVFLGALLYATQKRPKLRLIIPSLIMSAILITIIGIIRNPNLASESLSKKIVYFNEVQSRNSFFSAATIELAGSFKTLNVTVSQVPTRYDFFYGEFALKNVFSVIPGFSSILIDLNFENNNKYTNTSSGFITYLLQGRFPDYGNGTSCVAEVYLDFGVFGCLVFFFFFGNITRKMEENMFNHKICSNLFSVVLSICLFSLMISLGRKSIFDPLILAVRVYIFIYANYLLNNSKNENIIFNR